MDGPELLIPIRPSRLLQAALVSAFVAALAAPWLAAIPTLIRLLLDVSVLLVARSAWRGLRRESSLELRAGAQGWSLCSAAGCEPVEPLPDSTVWPLVTVLRLRSATGLRVLVLLPDSAPAWALRRLRAALRLGAGRSGGDDGVDGVG